jgi:hypothetical protein
VITRQLALSAGIATTGFCNLDEIHRVRHLQDRRRKALKSIIYKPLVSDVLTGKSSA